MLIFDFSADSLNITKPTPLAILSYIKTDDRLLSCVRIFFSGRKEANAPKVLALAMLDLWL